MSAVSIVYGVRHNTVEEKTTRRILHVSECIIGYNFHFDIEWRREEKRICCSHYATNIWLHTHTLKLTLAINSLIIFAANKLKFRECEWGRNCMHILHANKMKVKIGSGMALPLWLRIQFADNNFAWFCAATWLARPIFSCRRIFDAISGPNWNLCSSFMFAFLLSFSLFFSFRFGSYKIVRRENRHSIG